ncbi:oxidation resistance protein 1 [Coniochaeta sp. 2T2.1]|nr:oxidation resistance protein 1 [Coniochaeta sp. 2T2.1]
MSSLHSSQLSHPPRSPASASPRSSGPTTPTEPSAASSTFLSSSVSGLWGGLVRRFSAEATPDYNPSQQPHPKMPSTLHHANTFNGVDGVYVPPQIHRQASPMTLPPLEPLTLNGFREDTPSHSRLLTPAIAEEIRNMVPARLGIGDEWNLVYSLDQDGASLATLYEKCSRYQGRRVGFVLVVKDHEGGIFGAYLSDFPHPSPKYFGTGECFLWRASLMASLPPPPSADTTNMARTTTIQAAPSPPSVPDHSNQPPEPPASPQSIRFKAFPYSGVNEYYMMCEPHYLSVGAGDGRYGLWLDDSLERGHSSTCLTFGNERLSDEGEKFGVLGVEVWVIGATGP